jgi:outer membrane receptor protein involved in Fe transport
MGPRPLDSTNTVQAAGTSVWNLSARRTVGRDWVLGLEVFNLTNQSGNDIEYFYASCTAREVSGGVCGSGIDDRHVHPMESRTLRVSARMNF